MRSPYFKTLYETVRKLGGFENAHLHLCRAGTYEKTKKALSNTADSHLSIAAKHGLIPLIHQCGGFSPQAFSLRMKVYLDMIVESGTTRAATLVDVVSDTIGTDTFEEFIKLKETYSGCLDLQLGSYCPLGYPEDDTKRWDLFAQTAKGADFIGALPERDDRQMYPKHIGFRESVQRILELSFETKKSVHMHVDQKNDAQENGCEIVLDEMEKFGRSSNEMPKLWLIHAISPSAYDEVRFRELLSRMKNLGIGVICCPSAAISMRQLRTVIAPTHNSIARILDLLASGIHVKLGSDNICDITSPAGTADLMDEIFLLSNAIRFYDIPILARLGAGQALNMDQIEQIREHLEHDAQEAKDSVRFTRSSIH